MELANFKDDFWHLRNGEKCHRDNPDTFWIPSLNDRKALKVGDVAKIILEIECEDEMGQVHIESERGYVIISQIVDDKFIGILDFQPCCIEPNEESVYLGFGVEIPFGIEHIIDIDRPPQDYIDWQLDRKPEKVWYRR